MARNQLGELAQFLDRASVNLLYRGRAKAAEDVVQDLQRLGPGWSGRFSNSWRISTPTGTQTGGTGQPGEPVPVQAPTLTGKDVRSKLLGSPFKIDNTSPYADIATDLKPGKFIDPGIKPVKEPVSRGERNRSIRGEPYPKSGPNLEGPNRATAPIDWFTDYAKGGQLDKTVERAMGKLERGFK
jgi:hypothetical protein